MACDYTLGWFVLDITSTIMMHKLGASIIRTGIHDILGYLALSVMRFGLSDLFHIF